MQAGRTRTHRTIEAYDLLPPDPSTRRAPVRQARPSLIEDAVFEVVGPARPKREQNDNPARPTRDSGTDVAQLFAVIGVRLVNRLERMLSNLSPQAFATLIASLFFLAFWIFGGFGALANQPAARVVTPFVIQGVFTEEQNENGMQLLAVGGLLMNQSGTTLAPPALSVVGVGGEVIGEIAPSTGQLASGQSVRFFGRFKRAGGKSDPVTIFPAGQ
jgi:hypothetical protein